MLFSGVLFKFDCCSRQGWCGSVLVCEGELFKGILNFIIKQCKCNNIIIILQLRDLPEADQESVRVLRSRGKPQQKVA